MKISVIQTDGASARLQGSDAAAIAFRSVLEHIIMLLTVTQYQDVRALPFISAAVAADL
jgi:hypothetical protein